jgi:hypothetical protein
MSTGLGSVIVVFRALQPGTGRMSALVIGLVAEKFTCTLTVCAVASSLGTRKTITASSPLLGVSGEVASTWADATPAAARTSRPVVVTVVATRTNSFVDSFADMVVLLRNCFGGLGHG